MKLLVLVLSFVVCTMAFCGLYDQASDFGLLGLLGLFLTCFGTFSVVYLELFLDGNAG